jgi:hypothetical protein
MLRPLCLCFLDLAAPSPVLARATGALSTKSQPRGAALSIS